MTKCNNFGLWEIIEATFRRNYLKYIIATHNEFDFHFKNRISLGKFHEYYVDLLIFCFFFSSIIFDDVEKEEKIDRMIGRKNGEGPTDQDLNKRIV